MASKSKTRKAPAPKPAEDKPGRFLTMAQVNELSSLVRMADALDLAILGDESLRIGDSRSLSELAGHITCRLRTLYEQMNDAWEAQHPIPAGVEPE